MTWLLSKAQRNTALAPAGPVLDLSGPKLRAAFEQLVDGAEASGGVERYVGALALKASLFGEVLGKGRVSALTETAFHDLCAFVTPVRRRIGLWLGRNGFPAMRQRLERLLDGWTELATADARIGAFMAGLPPPRGGPPPPPSAPPPPTPPVPPGGLAELPLAGRLVHERRPGAAASRAARPNGNRRTHRAGHGARHDPQQSAGRPRRCHRAPVDPPRARHGRHTPSGHAHQGQVSETGPCH